MIDVSFGGIIMKGIRWCRWRSWRIISSWNRRDYVESWKGWLARL